MLASAPQEFVELGGPARRRAGERRELGVSLCAKRVLRENALQVLTGLRRAPLPASDAGQADLGIECGRFAGERRREEWLGLFELPARQRSPGEAEARFGRRRVGVECARETGFCVREITALERLLAQRDQ
jgi:hypothetical protein